MNDKAIQAVTPAKELTAYESERNSVITFYKKKMRPDVDFGVIPGTNKPSLWQPGAEKLANLFGLVPEYTLLKEVEDFDKGFFYYKYDCRLVHAASGQFMGSAQRSCNSYEKKYRYFWKSGKRHQKKPDQLVEDLNTYQSMAQKRAFVAAVRTVTAVSQIFSEQDSYGDFNDHQIKNEAELEKRRYLGRMKGLFAAAKERGFSTDVLKKLLYKKYQIESLKDLSEEQLQEAEETLATDWKIVGEGKKPKKKSAQTEEKKQKEKQIECYLSSCKKTIMEGSAFCTEEHKDEWNKQEGYKRIKDDDIESRLKKGFSKGGK